MALAMDFGFLFDRSRQLLSIGFLAPEGALDLNRYDFLASEARLASFLRSPKATSRPSIGSGSAAPRRPLRTAPR